MNAQTIVVSVGAVLVVVLVIVGWFQTRNRARREAEQRPPAP